MFREHPTATFLHRHAVREYLMGVLLKDRTRPSQRPDEVSDADAAPTLSHRFFSPLRRAQRRSAVTMIRGH